LEESLKRTPPGLTAWARILIALAGLYQLRVKIPATKVDLVLGDEGLSLAEYGIPGRVLHTPGHSPGSVSVLLETGEAFVGDLAISALPMRLGPGLPILADDMQQVRESWRLLLDQGAKTVYVAHGTPFSAEIMRDALLPADDGR
jgi:glyoxylase-like metal-dependent hydrolase (beta-lactamase superfamily II)